MKQILLPSFQENADLPSMCSSVPGSVCEDYYSTHVQKDVAIDKITLAVLGYSITLS